MTKTLLSGLSVLGSLTFGLGILSAGYFVPQILPELVNQQERIVDQYQVQ